MKKKIQKFFFGCPFFNFKSVIIVAGNFNLRAIA